ncbi:kinase-like domain-containing protein [Pisolithus orientalis]|uniref:kinase-like domain-containing protein n=1 Tax=Pisolithus orientalis TaxID=936130 RepID=UPI002223F125|nr:kinase-like domain-containing protein [Pisolithus orientalis]KAI6006208.1 kinase-like domain-containing protein [Pisolithus orientalis]
MSDAFDVIPFDDIKGKWKKLGSGSFGNVYRGSYLGIEVAIKEVLPSNSYNVAKYFEREWRLMKESRHPNVVLYLGLSRAPPPDGRIFIVSEYIENGNLRMYIVDKTNPFPWRLRISFATDIARAIAYLHARKCIHRDIKGENLLVTTNGRLKITDFGFARIAARNAEESKRLTFCGTDSYMSPEILLGKEFDLPTDIFSMGVIFCEIAARKVADEEHFARTGSTFGIDPDEVRRLANPGCPPAFLALCLDCIANDPAARPTTRAILDRLRDIEAEVLSRPETEDLHLGSVKFMSKGKRRGVAPRIPSFGMEIGKGIGGQTSVFLAEEVVAVPSSAEESTSEEEAVKAIQNAPISVELSGDSCGATNGDSENSVQPLLNTSSSYTDLPKSDGTNLVHTITPSLSSVLTIKPMQDPNATPDPLPPDITSSSPPDSSVIPLEPTHSTHSIQTNYTYRTAHTSTPSIAVATRGHSSIQAIHTLHRFTLIKPGAKRAPNATSSPGGGGWNPLEILFGNGLLGYKCDICMKRIGWKPILECDDCGLRAHMKCGEVAPRDCGIRMLRSMYQQQQQQGVQTGSGPGPASPTGKVVVRQNDALGVKWVPSSVVR